MSAEDGRSTAGEDVSLRRVSWAGGHNDISFQILERDELLARAGDELGQCPELLEFDVVIHCQAGHGRHMIDFQRVDVEPGTVLHIKPGQLHQWITEPHYRATLLLFRRFRFPATYSWVLDYRARPLTAWQEQALAGVYQLWEVLTRAGESVKDAGTSRDALRDLAQSIVGIPRMGEEESVLSDPVYEAFRSDVERHLTHADSVQDRADRIGYSAKTVDRACQRINARSAKQIVDDRLILEARRMLALPGASVALTGRRLGFSEATNFTKYCRRVTGEVPSDWLRSW